MHFLHQKIFCTINLKIKSLVLNCPLFNRDLLSGLTDLQLNIWHHFSKILGLDYLKLFYIIQLTNKMSSLQHRFFEATFDYNFVTEFHTSIYESKTHEFNYTKLRRVRLVFKDFRLPNLSLTPKMNLQPFIIRVHKITFFIKS